MPEITTDKWATKWKAAHKNWEDKRVKVDNPASVMRDMIPLKRERISSKIAPETKHLLDGGNIGRSVQLTPTATPTTLLEVSGDDKYGRVISITLFTLGPDPVAGVPGDPAIATVEFGSGGIQAQAEVDVLQNTVFSLPASWIRISVRRRTHPASPITPTKVGAFITYLPISGGRPQRSLRQADIIAGAFPLVPTASATWTVPAFAKELFVGSEPEQPLTIDFANSASAIQYSYTVAAGDGPRLYPLSNDIRRIIITNDGAANINAARLIFPLGL